jgi:hypothetical protein
VKAREPASATWLLPPIETTALLVVVDEHEGYQPPAGIAEQAAQFARELITHGVDRAQIKVLVSEMGWGHFPPGCERLGRAFLADLVVAFQSIPEWNSGLLWMHWIGHGFYDNGSFMLLTADARNGYDLAVDLKELIKRLELARDMPPRQMFTIDACQMNAKVIHAAPPNFDEGGDPNASQFWLFGSRPGNGAGMGTGGGLFTAALMDSIDAVTEPATWPPDHDLLIARVTERLSETLGGRTDQVQYLTKQPRDADERNRWGELSASLPGNVRSLTAWPVPGGWQPGTYSDEFCSASRVSLALHLVVNRRRIFALVADPPEANLTGDLNQGEEDFRDCGLGTSRTGAMARRVWFTVDIWRSGDPAALRGGPGDWVAERRRWQPGIQPGFVLRIDLAEGVGDYRPVHAQGQGWVQRLRQECPDAPIVITVRTRSPTDGILAIRELASRFAADGPGEPSSFARMRPGEPLEAKPLDGDPLDMPTGPPYLPALLDLLHAAARGRRVSLPFASAEAEAHPAGPTAVRLAPLADALLRELEDSGLQLLSTAERDGDEVLLCAVRDLLPALFPHLLAGYAARRTGPGWGVSLAVAAQFDDDLATWLKAAADGGRGLNPRDQSTWPPTEYRKAPADAVALEMLRRYPPAAQSPGQPWQGEAWLPLAVSPAVAEAIQLVRYTPQSGMSRIEIAQCSVDLIAALVAALPSPAVLLASPVDPYAKQAWWALRAVAVRSPSSLWPLLRQLTDGEHGDFARSVLGVKPLSDEAEPLIAEKAAELNQILYSLKGGLP